MSPVVTGCAGVTCGVVLPLFLAVIRQDVNPMMSLESVMKMATGDDLAGITDRGGGLGHVMISSGQQRSPMRGSFGRYKEWIHIKTIVGFSSTRERVATSKKHKIYLGRSY